VRLTSFDTGHHESWGTVDGEHIFDLGALAGHRLLAEVLADTTLEALVSRKSEADVYERAHVQLLPPVTDRSKILCVGLNYADHIAEMKRATPTHPVVFTRFADSFVGDGAALIAPRNSTSFDYEGEFCIVIGKTARHVAPNEALRHIFGYTIMNDGSVRDYQRHTHQFAPGKNFPRSGAIGPGIVTTDEFGPVADQRIHTRVNGVVVQESSLNQLVFDVAHLIAYCSEWTVLRPGDVIATGTPGGVGDGRDPALWLFPGDVVEISVDGIGTLQNSVAEEE